MRASHPLPEMAPRSATHDVSRSLAARRIAFPFAALRQHFVKIFIVVITLERVVRRGYYVSRTRINKTYRRSSKPISLGFRFELHYSIRVEESCYNLKIEQCWIPCDTRKVLYRELHTVIHRRASDTC